LKKIEELLASYSQSSAQNSSGDVQSLSKAELQEAVVTLANQLNSLSESIKTYQNTIESQLTHGMNTLERTIIDIKSDINNINSQLKISTKNVITPESTGKTIQEELSKIRSQIICPTEEDKEKISEIVNLLIKDLSEEYIEILGLDLKKRLIEARTQVYEQTEGLAPRFRIMMDNFMGIISDETIYTKTVLDHLLIEGLRHISEIYQSAPVGQF
jgi:hypothetical protein